MVFECYKSFISPTTGEIITQEGKMYEIIRTQYYRNILCYVIIDENGNEHLFPDDSLDLQGKEIGCYRDKFILHESILKWDFKRFNFD